MTDHRENSRALSEQAEVPVREVTLTVKNRDGLHARPAALFVQEATRFKSRICVSNADGAEANGKSILEVLGLGVSCGAVLTIRTEGEDAEEAKTSIVALFERLAE